MSITIRGILAIDTDGVGPHHDDRTAQNRTSAKLDANGNFVPASDPRGVRYLNADTEEYSVAPTYLADVNGGPLKVGDMATVTLPNGTIHSAPIGDFGPRAGEFSYKAIQRMGVDIIHTRRGPIPTLDGAAASDIHVRVEYFPEETFSAASTKLATPASTNLLTESLTNLAASETRVNTSTAGAGWEFRIDRQSEQRRSDGRRRTVGRYQIFHDGVPQNGSSLWGTVAESRGPGANAPRGNGRRVEAGRYPLYTQDGAHYVTIDYTVSVEPDDYPKPGLLLGNTDAREGILIHPGVGFLASIGCINPCTSLPNADEQIDFIPSRDRVINIINDLKAYSGTNFPRRNGREIPNAFVVIVGEP